MPYQQSSGSTLDLHNLFSDSQYGFHAGRYTADFLIVISDHVYCALDICGEARAIALDISKAFDKVWLAVLLMVFQAPFWHQLSLFFQATK